MQYQPGDVLWRTGARSDFIGVVQQGELLVERRVRGAVIHSTRLAAGDLLLPEKLSTHNSHSVVLVRALTGVQIQVLPPDWLQDVPRVTNMSVRSNSGRTRSSLDWFWTLLIVAILVALSWGDLTRITSGVLFLLADPDTPSTGDDTRRMALLQYAEAVDASAAFAPNQTGYVLFQDQNLAEAEAAFMEAVSREPAGSPALNNLAVICFLTGRYTLAVELEEKAVQNAPDDPTLRYNLGLALVAADRGTEALREFMQASYINPAWAPPHIQRAQVYIELEEYDRAEEAAAEGVRLDASQVTAHLIHAIALYNRAKYPGALEAIETALSIEPENRVVLFYRALILSGLQQFDPALAILNQLLTSTEDPLEIARIMSEIQAVQHFKQESLTGRD